MESSQSPPSPPHDGPATLEPLNTADMISAGFIGNSPGLRYAVSLLKQFSTTDMPVLILGETGTGKEVAARAVHHWSGRSGNLVDINCGALPGDLVEGELFGHRRGAFTGARDDRGGLIEAARNGTLFLDEIGSLPRAAQAKLLRVLESGEVRRLGDTVNRKVPFRLVAAGHALLLNDQGFTLREDLLHRLRGVVVTLPPLRERAGDAELIAEYYAREHHATLAPGCEPMLRNQPWPGNIRELVSVMARACSLASAGVITNTTLRTALSLGATFPSAVPPSHDPAWVKRDAYLRNCIALRWSVAMIATDSGVHRSTVYRWLKEHRLKVQ